MQDLIDKLKQEAGLTDDQAKRSLHVIKDYIHSKVPPMFSGIVDNFLGAAFKDGSADDQDPLSGGGFAQKAEDLAKDTSHKIEHIADVAKEDVEGFARNASHSIDEWAVKTEEAAKDAVQKLKGMMNEPSPKP